MALQDYFGGRTVIRLISKINGLVENASDYEAQGPNDVSTPGKWELLLSFAENHQQYFDIEFSDAVMPESADKKGNYTRAQLEKMGVPRINELLAEYNMSGMPSKAAAIQAILDSQGAK